MEKLWDRDHIRQAPFLQVHLQLIALRMWKETLLHLASHKTQLQALHFHCLQEKTDGLEMMLCQAEKVFSVLLRTFNHFI